MGVVLLLIGRARNNPGNGEIANVLKNTRNICSFLLTVVAVGDAKYRIFAIFRHQIWCIGICRKTLEKETCCGRRSALSRSTGESGGQRPGCNQRGSGFLYAEFLDAGAQGGGINLEQAGCSLLAADLPVRLLQGLEDMLSLDFNQRQQVLLWR